MIGLILDGIIGGALDAVRVLFMSREQERRWVNADRGDSRPIYAPPITREYEPWPYQPWPGERQ